MSQRSTLRARAVRTGLAAVGMMIALVIRPEPVATGAPLAGRTKTPAIRALELSGQARRYLELQYRSYPTEFMGCMIGAVEHGAVRVSRIAPADVEPARSTTTEVIPKQSCEEAGWSGTVGVIHSHPEGQRCWYFFPSTVVPSSDAVSFTRQSYPVDAIMCGDHVVWIGRDMAEQQLRLVDDRSTDAATPAGR